VSNFSANLDKYISSLLSNASIANSFTTHDKDLCSDFAIDAKNSTVCSSKGLLNESALRAQSTPFPKF